MAISTAATCAARCTSRRCAPGVQLYTGNWLGDEHAKDDANYGWGAGFALEAEMYPDTPHQPLFPQGIVGPGHPYSNVIEYHFMRH